MEYALIIMSLGFLVLLAVSAFQNKTLEKVEKELDFYNSLIVGVRYNGHDLTDHYLRDIAANLHYSGATEYNHNSKLSAFNDVELFVRPAFFHRKTLYRGILTMKSKLTVAEMYQALKQLPASYKLEIMIEQASPLFDPKPGNNLICYEVDEDTNTVTLVIDRVESYNEKN